MQVKEVIKILERDGWYMATQKGSHRQYKHSKKRGRCTVPGKTSDNLHPKTLKSILKQAGLLED